MEEWRGVVGFEGLYEVSNNGRVRSLDREVISDRRGPQRLRGRELKPGVASTGYYSVALCRDGKPRSYTIHEMVAAAFIGPRPPSAVLDHIDGNRKNNQVANLRYVSQATNMRNMHKANAASGVIGVYPNGKWGWQAQIAVGNRKIYLGSYRTIAEAAEARRIFVELHDHKGLAGKPPSADRQRQGDCGHGCEHDGG